MANQNFPPRTTEIAGQPHLLSYITPKEAGILKLLGGAGKAGPMGIPSFYDEGDDYSGPGGDSFADASGGQTSGMSDSDLGYGGDDDDGPSYSEVQKAIEDAKKSGKTVATITNIGGSDGRDYEHEIVDQFGNKSYRDQYGNFNRDPITGERDYTFGQFFNKLGGKVGDLIGFDPKKSLTENLMDTVIPGRNTPLGILSPAITMGTSGLSDAAKYGISLGNYALGQSKDFKDFVGGKLGPDQAQNVMDTFDFSNVVDETQTRPAPTEAQGLATSIEDQIEKAIQSTTGAQQSNITGQSSRIATEVQNQIEKALDNKQSMVQGDITREGILGALGVPKDTPETQFGEPVDTSFLDTQTNVFGSLTSPLEFLDNNLMRKGNVYTSGSSGGITGGKQSSGMDIGKMADAIGDVIGYGYYRNR